MADMRNPANLVLADGTKLPCVKTGRIDVRASYQGQETYFSNILVFLVDSPHWVELLIGRPTLAAHGLLPEQNLRPQPNQQ